MDVNKAKYKQLRSKVYGRKKYAYNYKQVINNLMSELIPRTAPAQKKQEQPKNTPDYSKEINKLTSKLNDKEKESSENTKLYNEKLKSLGSQIQAGDQKNYELSESLKQAIENISRAKQQQPAQQQKEEGEEKETGEGESSSEYSLEPANFFNSYATKTVQNNPVQTDVTTDGINGSTNNIDETVKKLVLEGYTQIGEYKYRTTNLFGPRVGKNDVKGRTGQHSGGVDLVGHDKWGNNKNLPIVVADGTIMSILPGENGNRDTTDGKASSGYVAKIRMNNGKVMTYAHLSPQIYEHKAALLNKKVKRGELLYDNPDGAWTGTGTAPHIKLRVQSFDGSNLVNDYTNPDNDPSPYILYGKK